jgi:large subunit ribosomal protein L2
MEGTVERLEYDPNRTAFIALVKYEDGEQAYILAPQRLAAGDKVDRRQEGRREAGQRDGIGPDAGRHDRPQRRDEAGQGRPDRPFGRHLCQLVGRDAAW